jgi:hypothetical protein
VHPIFLALAERHGIEAELPNVWVGLPLTSVVVYAASACFVIVVLRIPYLRRVMGAGGKARPD